MVALFTVLNNRETINYYYTVGGGGGGGVGGRHRGSVDTPIFFIFFYFILCKSDEVVPLTLSRIPGFVQYEFRIRVGPRTRPKVINQNQRKRNPTRARSLARLNDKIMRFASLANARDHPFWRFARQPLHVFCHIVFTRAFTPHSHPLRRKSITKQQNHSGP